MPIVDVTAVPEEEQRSPSGKFHSHCRNVSLALGGRRNIGLAGGGHPFDFQIRRLPPGAAVCPLHTHLAQWELFLVRSGTGTVRVGADARHAIRPGDVFLHPPGEPHQLINTGDTELVVFIFADNPPVDGFHYPDSQKWGLRPPSLFFHLTEADYFAGEEPGAPAAPPSRPIPVPECVVPTPFAARKLHLDDLPWATWSSPKGKFRGASKELSLALGARRNTPAGLGGHPFDLELVRLAPGERSCPFHAHAAQWEMFIILAGRATIRAGATSHSLAAGQVVLHPPFEAHDLANCGDTDLLYLLVADNPPVDYWHYPDSGKWGLREPRQFFRTQPVDYYDGEE